MSKCKAATTKGLINSDQLFRFIESIHIGGKPIKVETGAEVLYSPRNLESLVRSTDVERLNVLASEHEIEESVLTTVVSHIDNRFSEFEKRIENLLKKKY